MKLKETFFKEDKLKHIAISSIMTVWFFVILKFITVNPETAILSMIFSILIGAFKEWYDSRKPDRVSSKLDFFADCIGTLIVGLPLIFI